MPNVVGDIPFPFHVCSSRRLVNGVCLRRRHVVEQGPEPTSPQGACSMSKNESSVVVALSHRDVGPVCYCSSTSLALPETGHLSGHRETYWVDMSTVGAGSVERVEMAGSAQIVCKMWTSDRPMRRGGWVREKVGGSAGYLTLPLPPASPLPYFSSLCPRRHQRDSTHTFFRLTWSEGLLRTQQRVPCCEAGPRIRGVGPQRAASRLPRWVPSSSSLLQRPPPSLHTAPSFIHVLPVCE